MSPSAPTIPISTYRVSPEAEELVLQVLRSGQLAQGPMVQKLEDLSADMAGSKYAVAFSNGTATLISALIAHGIGPGDEVITSPFTFVATLMQFCLPALPSFSLILTQKPTVSIRPQLRLLLLRTQKQLCLFISLVNRQT